MNETCPEHQKTTLEGDHADSLVTLHNLVVIHEKKMVIKIEHFTGMMINEYLFE